MELLLASCSDPQVQKKAFVENTVPLIISLKSLLEQKRSPVLRDLMAYLQVSCAHYLHVHLVDDWEKKQRSDRLSDVYVSTHSVCKL